MPVSPNAPQQIEAIVVTPEAPGRLALAQVAAPPALPTEALVKVAAISLNLGEVRRAQTEPAGLRTGWDLAGTVIAPAANGVGPRAGERVVGIVERGAWSAVVAVPTSQLSAIPDAVSFAQAACLPVAGLTALYALEQRGGVLGRRVLVTGASGGVGHFACQLARQAGAHVVGQIRRPELAALTREAGAHDVVVGDSAESLAAHGPYDLIIDGVGGALLGRCMGLLAKDGVCVCFGASSGADITFDVRTFFRSGRPVLYGLYLFEEFYQRPAWNGLSRLAAMIAAGTLKPHIAAEAGWHDIGRVAQALLDRKIAGKAVLHAEEKA